MTKLTHMASKIPRFDLIYRYIIEHHFIDVIAEFAIYGKPIGINQEQIVVFEIRTEF